MNAIIFVKQVPDISNIPEDAWDREKGTLKRAVLDSILNPLDLQAITMASRVIRESPDSKVVYLSMGPPQAREILEEALSRLSGEAVLLTDRRFAGADTIATSYALSRAVRKIAAEFFGGGEYVIFCGMQSVDGDTAQVPPQVAEILGMEQIAYAESIRVDKRGLEVVRIGPRGKETVRPKAFPVLITVTACMDSLYPAFELTRAARRKECLVWDADAVGAEADNIGLKGSKTQVFRIFSPAGEKKKQCIFFDDPAALAAALKRHFDNPPSEGVKDGEEVYRLGGATPSYKGEIWVYAESDGENFAPVAYELLGKARQLADVLGEKVGAVVLGHALKTDPEELIRAGADHVYVAEAPGLADYFAIPYKQALVQMAKEREPQIFLFGATPLGRELAPRVASALGAGLTADCTHLDIGDYERGSTRLVAILKQTRPALGGNIMATIMTKDSSVQMATVRPGIFERWTAPEPRQGKTFRINVGDLAPEKLEIVSREKHEKAKGVTDDGIIVSGGRGFRTREDFKKYLEPLGKGLGQLLSAPYSIGASRKVVEDGFTTHDFQVGQTGRTVKPILYVAVGISGAVQHISGMQNSRVVLAVNKDPHARIFDYADFGWIGDLNEALPRMTAALPGGGAP
ncbi:MAG: hypothetical protein HQL11_04745 [Candidatus Omnitrophica bacterium]|nr:hypothetical protein [Candidatus Omnitrophota bacterium]